MDSPCSSLRSRSSDESMAVYQKYASTKSTETPGPTSALLKDLLQAKKAQSRRASEMQIVDSGNQRRCFSEQDSRQVHSSPFALSNGVEPQGKHYRRSSGLGIRHAGTREMGARATEEYISKLNKENFDLKLEVFQRRKRADILEAKLEKMKTLETENGELQDINDDLIKELENKDQAIKEAVSIICELEEKVERTELAMQDTKPSTATPATKPPIAMPATKSSAAMPATKPSAAMPATKPSAAMPATKPSAAMPATKPSAAKPATRPSATKPATEHRTDTYYPSSSPPLQPNTVASKKPALVGTSKHTIRPIAIPTVQLNNVATPSPTKTPRRTPSFIRYNTDSASALRSIYLHENFSSVALSSLSPPRPGSVFSLEDNTDRLENFSSVALSSLSLHRPGSLFSLENTTYNFDPFDCSISSPRLSVLSDSSLASVYGETKHTGAPQQDHEIVVVEEQKSPSPSPSLTGTVITKTLLPPTPDTLASLHYESEVPYRNPWTEYQDNDDDDEDDDDETASTRGERSLSVDQALPTGSTFMGGQAATRPVKTYGTDMMFNGEDLPRRSGSFVSRVFRRASAASSPPGTSSSASQEGARGSSDEERKSGGRKWGRGIGRRVSGRIREGLRGKRAER